MPIYAYVCADCGSRSEVRQSFSDAALTVCDVCGGRLRRRYDSIGVTFNGPGFYRTDSRESGKSTAKSTETSTSSSSDAPGSKKSKETAKPAATSGSTSSGQ